MDFKQLYKNIVESNSPVVFFLEVKKIIESAEKFIEENSYYDRDNRENMVAVNVKLGSMSSFEDVLDEFDEANDIGYKEREYLENELGEQWSNKIFEMWLDCERENAHLALDDFFKTGVLNEKEVYFTGRSGGYLTLASADDFTSEIEDIQYYLDNNFTSEGRLSGDFQNFKEFKSSDEMDEILAHCKRLTELDVLNDAVNFVKERVKSLNKSWRNELYLRLEEFYNDNLLEIKDYCDNDTKKSGGSLHSDDSLFNIFLKERFRWLTPSDSYYHTWKNRWEKGVNTVWNEADDTTRKALINAIEKKYGVVGDVKLQYTDKSLPIDYLFVKNRFGRDFTDSYVSNWSYRFSKTPEQLIGYMDTQSLETFLSVLKFKNS